MFIILINIEAPILNWTVTQPLINVLRLTNLSTAYRAWNWLQLAIDLYKVPVLIIIPIKTVKVYYNTIAVAILQANRSVFMQDSIVNFIVSSEAVSRYIQALLANFILIEVTSSIISVLKVVIQAELLLSSSVSLLKSLVFYIQALKSKLLSLFLSQAAMYCLKQLLKLPLLRPLISIKCLLQLSLD